MSVGLRCRKLDATQAPRPTDSRVAATRPGAAPDTPGSLSSLATDSSTSSPPPPPKRDPAPERRSLRSRVVWDTVYPNRAADPGYDRWANEEGA